MNAVELVSGLAARLLSEGRVSDLRSAYFSWRARLAPVMVRLYGTFDSTALRDHLEQRIGRDFEILMVHSSVNHMKPMFVDEPLKLVRMLIDFCGPQRTLAMPAFYFGEDGLGAHPTFLRNPRVDLRRTPSQMGLATELFRRMPGVHCSRHPVYRIAAFGPLAQELTSAAHSAFLIAGCTRTRSTSGYEAARLMSLT